MTYRQRNQSVADYSVGFWTLAREDGWEENALVILYTQGLSEDVTDELTLRELPESFDTLIDLTVWVDNHRRERS